MIGVLWVALVVLLIANLWFWRGHRLGNGVIRELRNDVNFWREASKCCQDQINELLASYQRLQAAMSKSDAENAALRSELAELTTYVDGLKVENESLKRTRIHLVKKSPQRKAARK